MSARTPRAHDHRLGALAGVRVDAVSDGLHGDLRLSIDRLLALPAGSFREEVLKLATSGLIARVRGGAGLFVTSDQYAMILEEIRAQFGQIGGGSRNEKNRGLLVRAILQRGRGGHAEPSPPAPGDVLGYATEGGVHAWVFVVHEDLWATQRYVLLVVEAGTREANDGVQVVTQCTSTRLSDLLAVARFVAPDPDGRRLAATLLGQLARPEDPVRSEPLRAAGASLGIEGRE